MKALLIFAIAAVLWLPSYCQGERNEFETYSNGLMYSESDMRKLRYMVDSLNLRFKTCDLTRPFYSFPQTRVFRVTFESKTNDLKGIASELDKHPGFYDIIRKYRALIEETDTTQLLIKTGYANAHINLAGTPIQGYDYVYALRKHKLEFVQGKWFYDYSEKDEYTKEYSLDCWYFPGEFVQTRMPAAYAALIQYVDCMIDTSATVSLVSTRRTSASKTPDNILKLVNYIHKKRGLPEDKAEEFYYGYINEAQYEFAKDMLREDSVFIQLLNAAADDCIKFNTGGDLLEHLVQLMISKPKSLQMKRSRIVVGSCSQDISPRIHAKNIALLAAETHSWDIFLRAHLDIMNDRFERVTDGSYAYGDRQTYLKELEELNLNVVDLMLGLTLRASNTASNHYYGTVYRTGWALTESKERKSFETRILYMIKDPQLDEFNRGLLFMLYISYLHRLNDEKEANASIQDLKYNSKSFPASIQPAITKLKPITKEKK